MNIHEKISGLIDISEFLSNTEAAETLKTCEKHLDDAGYIVAFMGQFSAGKSCLINNILNRKLLPVHVTETTALITYILYSENEYAVLEKNDGSSEKITIEESMKLWQNGELKENLKNVAAIYLFINSDILENGLVIADTPGINTIIESHIEKTVNLLESAGRIIYVMSKSLTQSDTGFLKCIRDNGIDITFVRTHMDLLNEDEENLNNTVKADKTDLKAFSDDSIFYVSSLETSKYHDKIQDLTQHISKSLAADIKENIEISIDKRIKKTAEGFIEPLNERKKIAEDFIKSEKAEYDTQKDKTEEIISKLYEVLDKNKKSASDKVNTLSEEAKTVLSNSIKSVLNRFSEKIQNTDFVHLSGSFVSSLENDLKEAFLLLREEYISCFDRFIKKDKESIMAECGNNIIGISIDEFFPDDIKSSDDMFQNLNSQILSLEKIQESLNSEIEECSKKIENADEQIISVDEKKQSLIKAREMILNELSNYGEYVERYKIVQGDHKNENKLRNIGKKFDTVLEFITEEPAKAIVSKIKESRESDEDSDKIDSYMDIAKTISVYKKSNTDRSNSDFMLLDNEVYEGESGRLYLEKKLKENKANFSDYLSVEYHLGKIGKKFDTPDRVVIDEEWARKYEEGRNKIVRKFEDIGKENADLKIKMLHIFDEKEQEEIIRDEKRKILEKTNIEIESLNVKVNEEKEQMINKKSSEYFIGRVSELLSDFRTSLLNELNPVLNKKLDDYLESYGISLKEKISKQKQQLDLLAEKYANSDKDVSGSDVEKCKNYLEFIEDVMK